MKEITATLAARSLGLLFRSAPRNILRAHGIALTVSADADAIFTWGRGKTFARAIKLSQHSQRPIWTGEDGFLRSLYPGRSGDAPQSLMLDRGGVHYDANSASDIRQWIVEAENMSEAERSDAEAGIARLKNWHLSKYNAFQLDDPDLPLDYVLVVDQVRGDASIRYGGASAETFNEMLMAAIAEHPNVQILIKTHPESRLGKRRGYFEGKGQGGLIRFYDKPISPWSLFERARAVYTVSSQMGLEAIFAGHRPIVFGRPFYAGWGLTDDRHADGGRRAWRKPEDLFWAGYTKPTLWFDPIFERASDFNGMTRQLHAEARTWRSMDRGANLYGFNAWKMGHMRRYASIAKRRPKNTHSMSVACTRSQKSGNPVYRWGMKGGVEFDRLAARSDVKVVTVEDGFIRSKGLGAGLRQPYSLVFDDVGIYFDARSPSALEALIEKSIDLPQTDLHRARRLREAFVAQGISKYNLSGTTPDLPKNKKLVLVLGQVGDDASILYGSDRIASNDALLWAARQDFPKAHLIYKPHPDVVAGLRSGEVSREVLRATADQRIADVDISALIGAVDHVATISSLGGFEALLRGKPVTTYGTPFYAGWGLTTDRGRIPERRAARPNLDQLTHAVLIDYPLYWDPVTERPCPPEVLLERFADGKFGRHRPINSSLARVQNLLAPFATLWR